MSRARAQVDSSIASFFENFLMVLLILLAGVINIAVVNPSFLVLLAPLGYL